MSDTDEKTAASSDTKAPATPAAKKGRGRPPKPTEPKTTQQQIEQVEAQLQKLKQAKQLEDEERDSIVGKALVADALEDAEFRKQVATRLRKRVTGKRELGAIRELLK